MHKDDLLEYYRSPKHKATINEDQLKRLFYVSLACNTVINFDHGIIPASTFMIREELEIDELFLGILGSVVFAGLMCGSLISGYLFTKYSCKHLILTSLVMIIVSILGFVFSDGNLTILLVSRFLSGFFQVFLVVYYPVWVDYFGEEKKTLWLTYLQIGVPFGVFCGYSLTGIFNTLSTMYPVIDVGWSLKLVEVLVLYSDGAAIPLPLGLSCLREFANVNQLCAY